MLNMNILEQEDLVKGLPDNQLLRLAKMPEGPIPQYMYVSEVQRRSDMRKRFAANKPQQNMSVADQVVQEGIGSVQPTMMAEGGRTPFTAKYYDGGLTGYFDEGVKYLQGMGNRIIGRNQPTAEEIAAASDVTFFDPAIEKFRQIPQSIVNKITQDYPNLAGSSMTEIANNLTPEALRYYENEDDITQQGSGQENVELLTEPNLDIPEIGDFPELGQETKSKERTNPLYAAAMNLGSRFLYPQGNTRRDVELGSIDRQSVEGIKTGIASLSDSLNDPNRLPFPTTAFDVGKQTRMTATNALDRLGSVPRKAYEGGYNLTADIGESAENLARGLLNLDETPKGFRYKEGVDSPLLANVDLGFLQTDESAGENKINADSTGTVTREQLIAVANPKVEDNVFTTDGNVRNAFTEDGKEKDETNKAFDLLGERLAASQANTEGFDKTTMGLILAQLGAGIAQGNVAGGLQAAGKVAMADKQKREDREFTRTEKELDREVQKEYYKLRRQEFGNKKLADGAGKLRRDVIADERIKKFELANLALQQSNPDAYQAKLSQLQQKIAEQIVRQAPSAYGGVGVLELVDFTMGGGGLSGPIVATFDSQDDMLKFN